MSEAARADLYNGLAELLGPERAETLMTHLPRYDPNDVATKSDVAELKSHMADIKSAISGLRSELKGDISGLRSELKGDISGFRSELKGDIADLRAGHATLNKRLDRLFLTLVAGLFVIVASMAGVVFATL